MELDEYQEEGAQWLADMPRALLADVMGIGKSAQAVTAADKINARTINILCQGAKRLDWVQDLERWSCIKRPIRLIEGSRDTPIDNGVNICSWDLSSTLLDYMRLLGLTADLLLIDEVQFLKSPGAQRTKTILGKEGLIHYARRHWLLSGTPFLSHPGEMWTWLYTLFPEAIDNMNYESFVDRYCKTRPCRYRSTGYAVVGGQNLDELRTKLAPVMLRRGENVVKLPSLTLEDMPIPRDRITDAQDIRDLAEAEQGPGGQSLKKALADFESGAQADLSGVRDKGGHIATLRKVTALAKARAVCEDLAEDLGNGIISKVVIFGIYRDSLSLVHAWLKAWGFGPELVWGGTVPKKRAARLHRFQTNYKYRVFVGQIDATGTGIDGLQFGAHEVVFLDSSWTPGSNAQAIKRVHRRGQQNPVRVRFASLENSLDEHVQRVNMRKAEILLRVFG